MLAEVHCVHCTMLRGVYDLYNEMCRIGTLPWYRQNQISMHFTETFVFKTKNACVSLLVLLANNFTLTFQCTAVSVFQFNFSSINSPYHHVFYTLLFPEFHDEKQGCMIYVRMYVISCKSETFSLRN
jgi:hypothetical protein